MMNAINTSNLHVQQTAHELATIPTKQPTKHPAASQVNLPEDTVHLSSAAKAALGDMDHDGDSH